MARPKSKTLTDGELRLMEVLWKRGPSTVAEVVEALPGKLKLAYSSALTTMRILEQKGFVRHEQSGRAFVYHAEVARSEARRSAVRHLIGRLFEGDPQLLMQNLLQAEELTDEDRARLRELIDEAAGGER